MCGLDYSFAEPAGAPAFFVICLACVPSPLLAVWPQVSCEVSVWPKCPLRAIHSIDMHAAIEAVEEMADLQPVFL